MSSAALSECPVARWLVIGIGQNSRRHQSQVQNTTSLRELVWKNGYVTEDCQLDRKRVILQRAQDSVVVAECQEKHLAYPNLLENIFLVLAEYIFVSHRSGSCRFWHKFALEKGWGPVDRSLSPLDPPFRKGWGGWGRYDWLRCVGLGSYDPWLWLVSYL